MGLSHHCHLLLRDESIILIGTIHAIKNVSPSEVRALHVVVFLHHASLCVNHFLLLLISDNIGRYDDIVVVDLGEVSVLELVHI